MKFLRISAGTILSLSMAATGLSTQALARQPKKTEHEKAMELTFGKDWRKKLEARDQGAITRTSLIDGIFPLALAEGKSIILVPMPRLASDYISKDWAEPARMNSDDLLKLLMQTELIWTNDAARDKKLIVNPLKNIEHAGENGYLLEIDLDNVGYFVYIVDPGSYSLSNIHFQFPRASAPSPEAGVTGAATGLGKVTFQTIQIHDGAEQYAVQVPEERGNVFSHNECTARVMSGPSSGQCISWTPIYDNVVTSQGGVRADTRATYSNGVDIRINLNRDFASFVAAPGEAVVVDGLFPSFSNVEMDWSKCQNVANKEEVTCNLKALGLMRLPASLAALQNNATGISEKLHYPQLAEILKTTNYRQLELQAQKLSKKPNPYELYYIR